MAKKIKQSDIFQGDIFLSQKDSAIAFLQAIQDVKKENQELLMVYKDLIKNNPLKSFADVKKLEETSKNIKVVADSTAKLTSEEQKQTKIVKQLTADEAKLKVELQEKNRVTKLEAQSVSVSVGAYKQLSAQLNLNKKNYKDLAAAGQANTKEAKELNKTIQEQDKRLKEIDASTGEFNRNVGNYTQSITEAFGATGLLGGELGTLKTILGTLKEGFAGNIAEIKNLGAELRNTEGLAGKTGKSLTLLGKIGKSVGKIGLIALVASAASFFTQFEEGQDAIEKFTLRVQSLFGVVVGYLGRLFNNLSLATQNIIAKTQLLGAEIKNIFTDNQKSIDALNKTIKENEAQISKNSEGMAKFGAEFSEAIRTADEAFEKFEQFDKILTLNAQRLAVINGDLAIQESRLNDTTLSFADREKAEKRALDIATEKGRIDLENIKIEEERFLVKTKLTTKATDEEIKQALATGQATERITQGILDEFVKRKTATIEVQNQINLALEKLEEARREREQKALINEVKIIREQAAVRFDINKKAAEDEALPYEEKLKAIDNAFNEAKKASDKEIELFQKKAQIQINLDELVNEQSATILEEKIRRLGLSQKLEAQISDTIANRRKLNEEEIQLINKAAEAEQKRLTSLAVAQSKTFTETLNFLNDSAVKKAGQNVTDTIEEQNRNIEEGFKANIDVLEQNINTEREIKIKALEDESQFRISNEQYTAEQIELEQLKLSEKIEAINKESNKKIETESEKLAKKQAEIDKKKTEQLVKDINTVTDSVFDGLNKRSQREIEAQDEEIDRRKTNIERQQELAAKGLENSLAFEQQKLAQAELEKKRLQDEQERREKRLAYIKAFGALVAEDPTGAAVKALSQVVIAESIVRFLKDGEENLKGPGSTTSDSIPAMLSRGESVVNARGTAETPGLATAVNKKGLNGAHEWFEKNILPKYFNNESISLTKIPQFKEQTPQIAQKLDKLTEAVKNKKEINISWDGLETRYETMISQGFKKTVKHVKQRPRI